ncbi:hypothetical protein BGX29_011373 [Mortierella sp. GBA35]|nr:hypothetical protein BGX29_011373 [Mortierella sp. GBA35]
MNRNRCKNKNNCRYRTQRFFRFLSWFFRAAQLPVDKRQLLRIGNRHEQYHESDPENSIRYRAEDDNHQTLDIGVNKTMIRIEKTTTPLPCHPTTHSTPTTATDTRTEFPFSLSIAKGLHHLTLDSNSEAWTTAMIQNMPSTVHALGFKIEQTSGLMLRAIRAGSHVLQKQPQQQEPASPIGGLSAMVATAEGPSSEVVDFGPLPIKHLCMLDNKLSRKFRRLMLMLSNWRLAMCQEATGGARWLSKTDVRLYPQRLLEPREWVIRLPTSKTMDQLTCIIQSHKAAGA